MSAVKATQERKHQLEKVLKDSKGRLRKWISSRTQKINELSQPEVGTLPSYKGGMKRYKMTLSRVL